MEKIRVMDQNQRRTWAMQARSEGKKVEEIACALAVTVPRVRQMLRDAERIRALPDWVAGLTVSTARVVVTRQFRNRDEVRAALDSGAHIDRIGPDRQAELRRWLAGEAVSIDER